MLERDGLVEATYEKTLTAHLFQNATSYIMTVKARCEKLTTPVRYWPRLIHYARFAENCLLGHTRQAKKGEEGNIRI